MCQPSFTPGGLPHSVINVTFYKQNKLRDLAKVYDKKVLSEHFRRKQDKGSGTLLVMVYKDAGTPHLPQKSEKSKTQTVLKAAKKGEQISPYGHVTSDFWI